LVTKNWISDLISERIWRRWNWIFIPSRCHKSQSSRDNLLPRKSINKYTGKVSI